MNELINNFSTFLTKECEELERIKTFLFELPDQISHGRTHAFDFQKYLEQHEIKTRRILEEKNRYLSTIAQHMNAPEEKVTLDFLYRLGYEEFHRLKVKLNQLSTEIAYLLLKCSIFLKNYARMNSKFKQINNFLLQSDYTIRGENPEKSTMNFCREA